LLYATDAYLRSFDGQVVALTPEGGVVLDRTAFYATGGGQPHDGGTLSWERRSAGVSGGRKDGGPGGPTPGRGAPAGGATGHWERRYALMRHHTALHAMSGVIYQLYGATVTGGQMYPDRARMDFLLPDLSADRLARIEARTNELLAEDHPVSVRLLPRAEALEI